jgi:hypothetical protein
LEPVSCPGTAVRKSRLAARIGAPARVPLSMQCGCFWKLAPDTVPLTGARGLLRFVQSATSAPSQEERFGTHRCRATQCFEPIRVPERHLVAAFESRRGRAAHPGRLRSRFESAARSAAHFADNEPVQLAAPRAGETLPFLETGPSPLDSAASNCCGQPAVKLRDAQRGHQPRISTSVTPSATSSASGKERSCRVTDRGYMHAFHTKRQFCSREERACPLPVLGLASLHDVP